MLIRNEMIRSTVLIILYSPRYENFLEPVENMSFNPLRQYSHVTVGPQGADEDLGETASPP